MEGATFYPVGTPCDDVTVTWPPTVTTLTTPVAP